jgi:putative membrane protein
MTRFPRSVFGIGAEPDARFSLANERTFLAWIRTALALMAAGVALHLLGGDLQPLLQRIASTFLVGAGVAVPLLGWVSWMRAERALRLGRPLPASLLGPAVAGAVTIAGALVLVSAPA